MHLNKDLDSSSLVLENSVDKSESETGQIEVLFDILDNVEKHVVELLRVLFVVDVCALLLGVLLLELFEGLGGIIGQGGA